MRNYAVVGPLVLSLALSAVATSQSSAPAIVSAAWLDEHRGDPSLLIVQVGMRHRPPSAWIEGASFLDYGAITRDHNGLIVELPRIDDLAAAFRQAGISADTHVVLYGSPAHLPARAWMTLDWLGHANKSLLDGGIEVWAVEGRPVSRQPRAVDPGTFQARVRDDVLVDAEWVRERLGRSEVQLIDARPTLEFTGEHRNGARPGHIPGATNLYWEELLESSDRPRLLELARVRQRLEQAGASNDKTIVSYCFIGMRASYNYVVARHLGFETRFYDGSWNEWSQRDELPVETGPSRH